MLDDFGIDFEGAQPWAAVHEQTLRTVGARVDLDNGLVSEDSIRALPEGFVIGWDVSGYTRTLQELLPQGQVAFAREIMRRAVGLAMEFGMPMLEPVAGDQALYFLSKDRESVLPAIQERLRTLRLTTPQGVEHPVKVVVVPVDAKAVCVGSFLDVKTGGVQRGYSAVTGPGAVSVIKAFKRSLPDQLTCLRSTVGGSDLPFATFDPSLGQDPPVHHERLKPLTSPRFPHDEYFHVLLHAKGRVSLADPMSSVVLAAYLFEATRGINFTPLKQSEGVLHGAYVPNEEGHAQAELAELLHTMNRALRPQHIRVEGMWDYVENPLVVPWGTHMRDGVGTAIAALSHRMKRKGDAVKVA
jgi:hypothetical protein